MYVLPLCLNTYLSGSFRHKRHITQHQEYLGPSALISDFFFLNSFCLVAYFKNVRPQRDFSRYLALYF